MNPTRWPGRGLLRDAAIAGVVAATVTVIIAAIADATDVSLEVDDKKIPLAAFAFWTLIAASLGTAATLIARTRRRFTIAAVVATGLSLIPTLAAPDDTATTIVLALTHLAAAAIIVPAIARNLQAP